MKPELRAARLAGLLALAGPLAPLPAQSTQSPPATPAPKEDKDVIQLSPFEVVDNNQGYYAPNTMSGTRMNSKLEDLGASITVITKEQMQDFALLDMNDIFNYEASTEGTGNYTEIGRHTSELQSPCNLV